MKYFVSIRRLHSSEKCTVVFDSGMLNTTEVSNTVGGVVGGVMPLLIVALVLVVVVVSAIMCYKRRLNSKPNEVELSQPPSE